MKRRRFLLSTVKTAAATACAQVYPSALRRVFLQQGSPPRTSSNNSLRPQLAFTMDDPTLLLGSVLKWQDANTRILKAIATKNVRAALFVCGMRVDEADGGRLLSAWDQADHLICNHSYSHRFYNNDRTSYADFAADFLKNERVIAPYHNRAPLFRYPFLKEGDTAEKRDRFRALLRSVATESATLRLMPPTGTSASASSIASAKSRKLLLPPYRDYLIAHLLDRAGFYRQLALDVLGRDIRHTLIIHFNAARPCAANRRDWATTSHDSSLLIRRVWSAWRNCVKECRS